jgi:CheY-like chemotaxis protein
MPIDLGELSTAGVEMKKVLIVDDEQSILIYLTTVLEDSGYATCSAVDGEEGLRAARRERPDLVCLDVMMPKRGGVSLYQEIKRDPDLRPIPVMFISAYNRIRDLRDPEAFRKMIPDPAIPQPELCMEKPIKVPEFLAAVAELTGQDSPPEKD